jgi:hypothetical protein
MEAKKIEAYYGKHPPKLGYNGVSGKGTEVSFLASWPEPLSNEHLIRVVWQTERSGCAPQKHCLVDAFLTCSENEIPDTLCLPSEMEGCELSVIVYVDNLDCLRMRAVSGRRLPSDKNAKVDSGMAFGHLSCSST